MAKRYRYAFAKKKEARKGKLSVGLSAASFLLFLAAVLTAFFGGQIWLLLLEASASLLCCFLFMAFIVGLLSFSEEKRTHRTSIIGSISNGIIMVGWLGFFYWECEEMEHQMERLKQQMEFIVEVDKVKNIIRQTYLSDAKRKENDAEHSWHLALMAVLLKEYSNEEVDLAKVVPMVLIHDLVEIDAGDTYAYDEAGAADKEERERKAADRIFGLLPKNQGTWFRELWEEFEAYKTAGSEICSRAGQLSAASFE